MARVATARGGDDLSTVVGALLGVQLGESLRLVGRWSSHPTYGRQFEVDAGTRRRPVTHVSFRHGRGHGCSCWRQQRYRSTVTGRVAAMRRTLAESETVPDSSYRRCRHLGFTPATGPGREDTVAESPGEAAGVRALVATDPASPLWRAVFSVWPSLASCRKSVQIGARRSVRHPCPVTGDALHRCPT